MDKSKLAVATYNKIARKYAQQYSSVVSDYSYINKFLSYLPKGAKILDVGCGPGNFTNYLQKKGFNIEGIDLSREMIKIAKLKNPQGHFKIMDMRKLKYDDASFEGLLAAHSLIHIPSGEIPQTLKEFYEILKPGGAMMIIAQEGEPDKIVNEPLKKDEKIFINFFSPKRLSNFVTDAGFQIEYIKEVKRPNPYLLGDKAIYLIARKL
jgi:ubiquinone/menaquinone biosynthesis C-methylase UbiE